MSNQEATVASGDLLRDKSIGHFIAQANNLNADEVERILTYQKREGVRFGEAAVALGLAKSEDVLWALSQQFHYPYAPKVGSGTSAELVLAYKPFCQQAEAFRVLRSQINMRLFSVNAAQRAVAVLSPGNGDGKSFFAANLAVGFSQLGGRTLLLDANMRDPRQHEIFGVDNNTGLSNILSGRVESNVIRAVRDLPSLFVLPGGTLPPNPLELLERPAFGLLLRELQNKFDYVIVDSPASSQGADYSVIAARCGAALIVARQNHSRMQAVQDIVDSLGSTPTTLAGVVMNEH